MDILKVKTKTAIDSITVVGIKTLLNTASIASQDKRESIYNKLSKKLVLFYYFNSVVIL